MLIKCWNTNVFQHFFSIKKGGISTALVNKN